MKQQVINGKSDGFLRGALTAVEQAAMASLKVEKLKERASHVIEDGIVDAKRLAKRGRYAAEDLVEDTAHRIKKDPWPAVGITFGIGLGLGVVMGLLVASRFRKTNF